VATAAAKGNEPLRGTLEPFANQLQNTLRVLKRSVDLS
jgi:hypothetical protein